MDKENFATPIAGVTIDGTPKTMLVDADGRLVVSGASGGGAEPGDRMDLVDAPNGVAITAIQLGLAQDATVAKELTLSAVAAEVTAVKAVTDVLPDGGALSSLAQDATVAKELTLSNVGAEVTTINSDGAKEATLSAVAFDVSTMVSTIASLPDGGSLTSIAQEVTLQGVASVTSLLPDGGSLTSIAQEVTLAGVVLVTSLLPDIAGNVADIVNVTNTLNSLESQINITAVNGSETDAVNIGSNAGEIASIVLKSADPGANTITVRLYQNVNSVLTAIKTFDITTVNFGTYFTLPDLFGLQSVIGGNLKITVRASAGGPYAITGSVNKRTL